MKSRWIAVLFGLLLVLLLVNAARRVGASLLDPQFFQFESKLIYVILSSVSIGALLLFLLVTFFPPWLRNRGESGDIVTPAKPMRKIAQLQTAQQLGDHQLVWDLLSTIDESDPSYWQAKKIQGDMHAEKGEWEEAAEQYRAALKQTDGQERALLLLALGNGYEQQDYFDQARDLYQQAIQISPNSTELILRLRALAVREQDWNEAMRLQEIMEQQTEETNETAHDANWRLGIRLELARSAGRGGNYKTAQALLKYIFRITDYFAPAYLLQGEIQERQHQSYSAGMKTYEEGFTRTQSPAILKRIGEKFLLQNQPQRAIDFLRDVVRRHPTDPRLSFSLGDLYRKLEMTEEALKVFESVRQRHPDWLLNNIALAELYERQGETVKALRLYKSVVDHSESTSVLPWQCYTCNTTYIEYQEFCFVCLEWNSVNLNQNKAGTMDFKYEKSTALPL